MINKKCALFYMSMNSCHVKYHTDHNVMNMPAFTVSTRIGHSWQFTNDMIVQPDDTERVQVYYNLKNGK